MMTPRPTDHTAIALHPHWTLDGAIAELEAILDGRDFSTLETRADVRAWGQWSAYAAAGFPII